jgi:hypothetical protein
MTCEDAAVIERLSVATGEQVQAFAHVAGR